MMIHRASLMLFALGLVACAPLPQRADSPVSSHATISIIQRPSPNFDERRPQYVIVHHTTDSTAEEALAVLTNPVRKVSAHYLIGRYGKVFQLVDERARAWHAGESYWAGQRDLNSTSIGIELDNDGWEPFGEAQIQALLELLADLKARYKIPAANFLGHGDIAPGRKVDPSALFPWKRLANQGYGVWCDPPYPSAPATLDTTLLLQTFGYSVWNVEAAIAAFKRHFVPDDPSPQMSDKDRSMLYCLILQNRASDAR